MDIRKWKILAIGSLLLCALAVPAFAYLYRTEAREISTGITLNTPTLGFGLYQDYACTSPLATIDFGSIIQPYSTTDLETNIYIKNEGDVVFWVFWNSTLKSENAQISEYWFSNGTNLNLGSVWTTTYRIHIPAYATVGIYTWILTVWGEY